MKWQDTTPVCDASRGFFGGKVDPDELTRLLNERGQDGWELVGLLDTNMSSGGSRGIVAVLKRPRG